MKKLCLALLALLVFCTAAWAQAPARGGRAGTNEFYLSPLFTDSKNFSFEGGTSAHTDNGYGFGFGFARNFNANFAAGVEFGWSDIYYRTTLQPQPGNPSGPINSSGNISTGTIRFNGTWNILSGNFTPLLTAGAGWTHIYTDVPSGPPQNSCWYYPWWGPVCTTYVPTQNTTKFSWNVGAGVRWDIGAYFVRGIAGQQSADIGGAQGDVHFTTWRLDFGLRFR
jgi:opacity protein-like surface antigen